MGRTIVAVMIITLLGSCLGRPSTPANAGRTFVEMRHVGPQDHPLPVLIVVASSEDLPPAGSTCEWITGVVVSPTLLVRVLDFVAVQARNYAPYQAPLLPFGSYEVSWQRESLSGRYVAPGESGCRYFRELQTFAKTENAAELDKAAQRMLLYTECRA